MVKYLAVRDSNKLRQIVNGYDAKLGNRQRNTDRGKERE